jgi:CBS domain-containing protein
MAAAGGRDMLRAVGRKDAAMIGSPPQPYPALGRLRVADAMHPGLISCPPDAPLRTVARMMATYRVHAILVTAHGPEELPGGGSWGIVSDADLLRAARTGEPDEQASGAIAAAPVLTVTAGQELAHAAQVMVEHEIAHLIVVDPLTTRPVGVLSSLDVARALAGFPEHHPAAF